MRSRNAAARSTTMLHPAARDEARVEQKIYDDQVAFSTIDLGMTQAPQLRRSTRVDIDAAIRASGPGFLTRIGQSLATGWKGLMNAIVLLAAVWPLWLGAALATGLLLARRRRGSNGRN